MDQRQVSLWSLPKKSMLIWPQIQLGRCRCCTGEGYCLWWQIPCLWLSDLGTQAMTQSQKRICKSKPISNGIRFSDTEAMLKAKSNLSHRLCGVIKNCIDKDERVKDLLHLAVPTCNTKWSTNRWAYMQGLKSLILLLFCSSLFELLQFATRWSWQL